MINAENFDREILETKKTAMLVFTADWCRPCSLQKVEVEKIVAQFADKLLIEVIDVDRETELSDRLAIKTLPATLLFAEGELVEHLHGFQAEDFLSAYLKHILEQCQRNLEADED
jgi:thioredoxin 1